MAAARACFVALALVAAFFVAGSAAAAAGNAGGRSQLTLRQRRRQLLRQRQVRSHLKRLNKAPLATIEVLYCCPSPPPLRSIHGHALRIPVPKRSRFFFFGLLLRDIA